MSRPWRIEYEGAFYHVMSRGNNRCDIFLDDKDRQLFLDILGDMAERFDVDISAYVLMGNHYHLLLRTNLPNLSRSMQWFGVSYTGRFNNLHHRIGHLFQGRFKSILVENDAYLLRLSYYIHRNPLRAGIVKHLADYRWSSYRNYAYGKKSPDWLSTNLLLDQIINVTDPHKAYRNKMQAYVNEEPEFWDNLRHGFILGSRKFTDFIKQRYLPDISHNEIPEQKRVRKDSDIETLLTKAAKLLGCDVQTFRRAKRLVGPDSLKRDILIYLLYQSGCWTNQQIGDMFNLTYSAVSRRVSILKKNMANDEVLYKELETYKSKIKM